EVTKRHGGLGLPDDTITVDLTGSAGQSFGAFIPKGVTLRLSGDANDYAGKGLSGGRIVVRPPAVVSAGFHAEDNIIAGNVLLYGATGGEAFFRGRVGERFAVRNSGANAVVEGVGDHACEYMTGGRVVILGSTGRNFGAGMSGGIAYVWDGDGSFPGLVNREMVDLDPLDDLDNSWLVTAVFRHQRETGSEVAARILADWQYAVRQFVKVMPRDYKRVLEAIRSAEEAGHDIDEAIMAAAKG
ncbi:MAG: glutamate synthase subunit alpha, partial [Aquihabitans sp.]